MNNRFLPLDDANLKASILRFRYDFMFVQSIKSFRNILASY